MSTHNIQFHDKLRTFPVILVFLSYGKNFVGTQKWVRISRSKWAIGVWAVAVRLYFFFLFFDWDWATPMWKMSSEHLQTVIIHVASKTRVWSVETYDIFLSIEGFYWVNSECSKQTVWMGWLICVFVVWIKLEDKILIFHIAWLWFIFIVTLSGYILQRANQWYFFSWKIGLDFSWKFIRAGGGLRW